MTSRQSLTTVTTQPSSPPVALSFTYQMTTSKYTLDREVRQHLEELLEDSIEFFCNEYMVSGELAWLITETFATAKLEQFKGNIT